MLLYSFPTKRVKSTTSSTKGGSRPKVTLRKRNQGQTTTMTTPQLPLKRSRTSTHTLTSDPTTQTVDQRDLKSSAAGSAGATTWDQDWDDVQKLIEKEYPEYTEIIQDKPNLPVLTPQVELLPSASKDVCLSELNQLVIDDDVIEVDQELVKRVEKSVPLHTPTTAPKVRSHLFPDNGPGWYFEGCSLDDLNLDDLLPALPSNTFLDMLNNDN